MDDCFVLKKQQDIHPAETNTFADCSIRQYWDEAENLWVDRDINAAINVKRVGLDVFPTIKRRKGKTIATKSCTDYTSKEVLSTLRSLEKPTLTR